MEQQNILPAIMFLMQKLKAKNTRRREEELILAQKRRWYKRLFLVWNRLNDSRRNEILLILQSNSDKLLSNRSIWVKPRDPHGWRFMKNQDDDDFREDFRVSKRAFAILCAVLHPYLVKADTHLRKAIPVEVRIAIALYALGSVAEYRMIGKPFGVPRNTVCVILHEFCHALINSNLKKRLLRFPKGDQLTAVVQGFEDEWGFPQCVGAIDGTHIPICPPAENSRDYFNRKGWASIIVQATCDFEYKFTSVNIGWPGSVHDARVFANSEIARLGSSGRLLPNKRRLINNVPVPLMILGDGAYPLFPWLLIPYKDYGNMTADQRKFNKRHSSTRMVIEGSFGRLKGRWRRLFKETEITLEKLPNIILACIVLHNLCAVHGDLLRDEDPWLLDVEQYAADYQQPDHQEVEYPVIEGDDIRECLKEYFTQT